MGFLSRVFRDSVNVVRAVGRGADDLRRGDLQGAAQARRDAGRTVVHGVKRDLGLGRDDEPSVVQGRVSTGFVRQPVISQCQSHSRDMLNSYSQLRNQWFGYMQS